MNYGNLFRRGFEDVARNAVISDDLLYRYQLKRWWDDALPFALLWMLNPSKADAAKDDPTIRRCTYFVRRAGCGGFMVVNWFGLRATDPKELTSAADPIGPENDGWIRNSISLCSGPIIAAWGAHKIIAPRLPRLKSLMRNREMFCLGTTKDGHPRHPLYVPNAQPLVTFNVARPS